MKRKIFLLTAIVLTVSLAMTACTQGSVSEAKAKELALDNINKVFQTNQTEATVRREQMGCLPDQVGAMATNGNAGERKDFYGSISSSNMNVLSNTL